MEMLLFKISGLLQNWLVLCPPEKKEINDPKKKRAVGGESGKDRTLVTFFNPRRHLKFHCSETAEDLEWGETNADQFKVGEMTSSGPWWRLMNASLELV